jgi:hypothetical protein
VRTHANCHYDCLEISSDSLGPCHIADVGGFERQAIRQFNLVRFKSGNVFTIRVDLADADAAIDFDVSSTWVAPRSLAVMAQSTAVAPPPTIATRPLKL